MVAFPVRTPSSLTTSASVLVVVESARPAVSVVVWEVDLEPLRIWNDMIFDFKLLNDEDNADGDPSSVDGYDNILVEVTVAPGPSSPGNLS